MTQPLCVIAGVVPGMGLAIAHRFAAAGFDLALLARQAALLERYAEELQQTHGVQVAGYPCDLAETESILKAFQELREDMGDADVLIYNAARWHEAPVAQLDPAVFLRELSLCAVGALTCTQQVLPAMQARSRGSLLFTGGGLALRPEFGAGVAALASGKSALRGLVYAMAAELAGSGVHAATVTIAGTVAPGGAFDPALIAEAYWQLHQQAAGAWDTEIVFDGRGA